MRSAALASHGKATQRRMPRENQNDHWEMNAFKDRIADTERVKERKRARVERVAGDVLMEPGNRDDEQVAVRHADASFGDNRENQHEEDRMRDIHI